MIKTKSFKHKSFSAERLFVQTLLVVLFCFAAMQISIFVPTRIVDIGRWLAMSTALYLGYRWQHKCKRKFFSKAISIDYVICLLLFLYFLSSIESVAKEKSFLYLSVCILQIILFTFLTRGLRLESWRTIFDLLALLCIFVSFMSLAGYATNPEKFIVQGRLAGMGNANSMGLIAMIGFIISLAKSLFAELRSTIKIQGIKIKLKWLYFVGVFACLTVLWLTGSRSSLGGTLSGAIVVLFFAGKTKKIIPALLLVVLLMPVMSYLTAADLQQKITTHIIRDKGGDVLHTRRYQWAETIDLFMENQLLGKGYAVHHRSGMVVDGSGYFGLLASVGAVGTLVFISIALWILWFLFKRGVYLNKRKGYLPCNRELMAFGGGGFVALLVQGVGEPWMLGPGSFMHVVYWLSVGACIAGITKAQVPTPTKSLTLKHASS